MIENNQVNSKRKSYQQICPMSTALDYIGDRWTILILRELLGGPARFLELRSGLQGIPSNLLTERLRRLEADRLVRQIHQHNTVLYALTEEGAASRSFLEELAFWGAQLNRVAPVKYQRSIRAIAMALQSILVRAGDVLPAERLVVELEVEGDFVEVKLDHRPTVTVRLPLDADARVKATRAGLSEILLGRNFDPSIFTHISGNPAATEHLIAALDWTRSLTKAK